MSARRKDDGGLREIKEALSKGRNTLKWLSSQSATGELRTMDVAEATVATSTPRVLPSEFFSKGVKARLNGSGAAAQPPTPAKPRPSSAAPTLRRASPEARRKAQLTNALQWLERSRLGTAVGGAQTAGHAAAAAEEHEERPTRTKDPVKVALAVANHSSRKVSDLLARHSGHATLPTYDFHGNVTVSVPRYPRILDESTRKSRPLSAFTSSKLGPRDGVPVTAPPLARTVVYDPGDMGKPGGNAVVVYEGVDGDAAIRVPKVTIDGRTGALVLPTVELPPEKAESGAGGGRGSRASGGSSSSSATHARAGAVQNSGAVTSPGRSGSGVASRAEEGAVGGEGEAGSPSGSPQRLPFGTRISTAAIQAHPAPAVAPMATAAMHTNAVFTVAPRLRGMPSAAPPAPAPVRSLLPKKPNPLAGDEPGGGEDEDIDGVVVDMDAPVVDAEVADQVMRNAYAAQGLPPPVPYHPGKGLGRATDALRAAAEVAASAVDPDATRRLVLELKSLEPVLANPPADAVAHPGSFAKLLEPALAPVLPEGRAESERGLHHIRKVAAAAKAEKEEAERLRKQRLEEEDENDERDASGSSSSKRVHWKASSGEAATARQLGITKAEAIVKKQLEEITLAEQRRDPYGVLDPALLLAVPDAAVAAEVTEDGTIRLAGAGLVLDTKQATSLAALQKLEPALATAYAALIKNTEHGRHRLGSASRQFERAQVEQHGFLQRALEHYSYRQDSTRTLKSDAFDGVLTLAPASAATMAILTSENTAANAASTTATAAATAAAAAAGGGGASATPGSTPKRPPSARSSAATSKSPSNKAVLTAATGIDDAASTGTDDLDGFKVNLKPGASAAAAVASGHASTGSRSIAEPFVPPASLHVNVGSADESLYAMRLVTKREALLDLLQCHEIVTAVMDATAVGKYYGLGAVERVFLRLLRALLLSDVVLERRSCWALLEALHSEVLQLEAGVLDVEEITASTERHHGKRRRKRRNSGSSASSASEGSSASASRSNSSAGDEDGVRLFSIDHTDEAEDAPNLVDGPDEQLRDPALARLLSKERRTVAAARQSQHSTVRDSRASDYTDRSDAPISRASRATGDGGGDGDGGGTGTPSRMRPQSALVTSSTAAQQQQLHAGGRAGVGSTLPPRRPASAHPRPSSSSSSRAEELRGGVREPGAHLPTALLSRDERAARAARRHWPVLLAHPMAVLLSAVRISDAEYGAWLEARGLQLPLPAAVRAMEQWQWQKANRDERAAQQAAALAAKKERQEATRVRMMASLAAVE